MRTIKLLIFATALAVSLAGVSFGQEMTGSIDGTVKDPQGNVVPGVTVTVEGISLGFNRSTETDNQGRFSITQVPPGRYKLTTSATAGFGEAVIPEVQVTLGSATAANLTLQAAGTSATVDISATDAAAIDIAGNKIQTNITARTAELLPKGVGFTSILNTAPAVRAEPLSGGLQIDGASGSENTFIIDGQEVSNFRTGILTPNNNIPFQFVQEVQVKSSGFEAEFGGATGGVINVVTRGGSNEFHGEGGLNFGVSRLEGTPRPFLRLTTVNRIPTDTELPAIQTAFRTQELIPVPKDGGTDVFPHVSLGGPIIKNRAWFFGSYAPQITHTHRLIEYTTNDPRNRTIVAAERYRQKQRNEYAFGRVDLQLFESLRLTGSYLWNPIDQQGVLPAVGTKMDTVQNATTGAYTAILPSIVFPVLGTVRGPALLDNQGGRQSSNNTTGSIVWTPTSRLVLTARGGYSFLNEKIGNYGVPSVGGQLRQLVQATGFQAPGGFGLAAGTQNFPGFSNTLFDVSRRRTFDADAAYQLSDFAGRHALKGGVQFNGISNDLLSTTVDTVVFRFGPEETIENNTGHTFTTTPGSIGTGWLQRFGAFGNAGSNNLAFYIQDSWQPISRLTLNIGLRTEREKSPSFNDLGDGIEFGFMDKLAPRLGVAFDVFGDGKTKLFGSYGQFYDRFKYELPRGSFGGNFFRNDYFEIFPGQTTANFNRGTIIGSNPDPIGGTCPITGTALTRCQLDFRIPSNLPGQPEFGEVDPDIKAFKQSEYTVGVEHDLGRSMLLRGRYTHKQVDVAVEDIGIPVPGGEAYVIGNPGLGLAREISLAGGFIPLEAVREFDAVEVGIDRRFANNFFFNTSYTWSRLFGNYAGLASSDENGRTSPNVNRNFDLPFIGFSALGKPDNGRLPTDRPHVFKFSGAYSYDWSKTNSTEVSGFTTIQSGTPVSTRFTLFGVGAQFLNGRGDLGRTEAFTQSDLGLRHRYRFGGEGRFTLIASVDILNLFDEANVLGRFETFSATGVTLTALPGFPTDRDEATTLFQTQETSTAINAFLAGSRDLRFNLPNSFQGARNIRFGFRLQF